MNNYCKKCRLRDGCIRKCKEAEVYEQGYNDAVEELKKTKKTAIEKELKIIPPIGYEIDRQKSTFEKIILKNNESDNQN